MPANADVDSAHDLANLAPWLAAAALSVVFPPWIFPGAGVVVLVVARLAAFTPRRDFGLDVGGE